MSRQLAHYDPQPAEIIPCSAVGEERIAAILGRIQGKIVRNCKTWGYSLGGQPLTLPKPFHGKRTLKQVGDKLFSKIKRKNKLLCFQLDSII